MFWPYHKCGNIALKTLYNKLIINPTWRAFLIKLNTSLKMLLRSQETVTASATLYLHISLLFWAPSTVVRSVGTKKGKHRVIKCANIELPRHPDGCCFELRIRHCQVVVLQFCLPFLLLVSLLVIINKLTSLLYILLCRMYDRMDRNFFTRTLSWSYVLMYTER